MIQEVWDVGANVVAVVLIVSILSAIFDWGATSAISGFGDPVLATIELTSPVIFTILGVGSIFLLYSRLSSPWQR